jgi:hypothetical protein
MTDHLKDGGPAFPTEPNSQPGMYAHHGMTLRDYFAAQALPSIIADARAAGSADGRAVALTAYWVADAMLAERAKGGA